MLNVVSLLVTVIASVVIGQFLMTRSNVCVCALLLEPSVESGAVITPSSVMV